MNGFQRSVISILTVATLVGPVAAGAEGWRIGERVPNLTANDQHGGMLSLHDLEGRVVVLHFCNLWCGPCQTYAAGIPALLAQLDADPMIGPTGHQVVEVLLNNGGGGPSTQADAQVWSSLTGGDVPVLHASGSSASPIFQAAYDAGLSGTPFFVILTPTLQVSETGLGLLYDVAGAANQATTAFSSPEAPTTFPESYVIDTSVSDTLIVSVEEGLLANDFDVNLDPIQVGNGPAYVNPDGSFSLTVSPGFKTMNFNYQASDGSMTSSSTDVLIEEFTIPQALDDFSSGFVKVEDAAVLQWCTSPGFFYDLSFYFDEGVDFDPDNEGIFQHFFGPSPTGPWTDAADIFFPPSLGTVFETTHGSIDTVGCDTSSAQVFWIPNSSDFLGTDEYYYYIVDGGGNPSAPAQVAFESTERPVAEDSTRYVEPGVTLVVPVEFGLLWRAQSPRELPVTAEVVTGPQLGNLTWLPDGSWVFDPDPSFDENSQDSFTFQISDGELTSYPYIITLLPKTGPNVEDDIYDVAASGTLIKAAGEGILANDFDPESDPFTFSRVQADLSAIDPDYFEVYPGGGPVLLPSGATLEMQTDGGFEYQASAGSYVETMIYTTNPHHFELRPPRFEIYVDTTTPNRDPNAVIGGPYEVEAGGNVPVDGSLSSDPDGDPLSFAWAASAGNFDVPTAAAPSYQAPMTPGIYALDLTVEDGNGGVNLASTSVQVFELTATNLPPVALVGGPYIVPVSQGVMLDGSASNDPDGGMLTYNWTVEPATGFNLSSSSIASPDFTPTQDGLFTATLAIVDSRYGFDSAQTSITGTHCEVDVVLTGTDVSGSVSYQAARSVAVSDVTLLSGAVVEFEAAESIAFGNGFRIEQGASMSARLPPFVQCNP